MKQNTSKTLPSLARVLGDIGELYVQQILNRETEFSGRSDQVFFIGEHLLRKDVDEAFDYNPVAIKEAAGRCRQSGNCTRFNPNKRPCLNDEFFDKNYNAIELLDQHKTGDNKFRYYCATKITKNEVATFNKERTQHNQFILDLQLCSSFIRNLWLSKDDSSLGILNFKPYDQRTTDDHKEWDKYWRGHPGKLDFFAKKNDKFYYIDSKVNTSKLSLWQHLRMNWMTKQGHECFIYNVKIKCKDKEGLVLSYVKNGVEAALNLVTPELDIIKYDPSMSEEAERLVSNKDTFLKVAQMTFPWDDDSTIFIDRDDED